LVKNLSDNTFPLNSTPQKKCRVLSLIPPMTQLNTPYPSTAYITGFLRSRGFDAVQDDLALKLVLRLFSAKGLTAIRRRHEEDKKQKGVRSEWRCPREFSVFATVNCHDRAALTNAIRRVHKF